MCGIAGCVNFGSERVSPAHANRMIETLRHRGPDGSGIYDDGDAVLAHARLSIIDLEGGRQPMRNEDGSLWITFNGEIFNYVELRQQLFSRGHKFATKSDTEVILHLFEDLGPECVHCLNGQWAFAIWDRNKRELFLSRDRLGVRPLFYTTAGATFLFASEVKALFAHPDVPRELDPVGLDQVFTFWSAIPPRTAFRNVLELPPGHSMLVTQAGVAVRPHWQPDYTTSGDGRSESEYAEELLSLLVDATRIRLRADVPVGAYLSGGIDSTFTTALIRKFTSAPLRTFSVSFADTEFDESAYQREAVRFLGTDHEEVRCTSEDIGRVFPDVIWHTEKPILRTAPAPLYILSNLVRSSGYKVVVTGEGADEMLGGYDIFKETKIRQFWRAHPHSRLRPLLLRRLYPYMQNIQNQPDAYRSAFFQIGDNGRLEPFFSHLPRWQLTSRLKLFFSDALRAELGSYDAYGELLSDLPKAYTTWNRFCHAQYLEANYLLPGYILSSQGDRVGMAHAVEGRFPFLDHRVVEFASRLPVRLKMKALNEKYLLKRCAEGLVPPLIRQRSKQPYRAPDGRSLMQTSAREYVEELLSADRLRRDGVFDPASVQSLLSKFRSGRAIGVKDNMALVGIVSTQLVLYHFIHSFSRRIGAHADCSATETVR